MTDLEAVKARLAAATPGPWRRDGNHRAKVRGGDGDTLTRVVPESSDEPWSLTDEANADLIAHAPGDIAALVTEVERLRAVEADAERARVKADLWSYYEAFVSANGAEGITQLVVQRDEARAEVERLRSINDDYLLEMGRQHALLRGQRHADNEAIAGAWDAGRDNERAAVVKWLRYEAEMATGTNTTAAFQHAARLDTLAEAIERGEHREENE